MCLLRNKIEFAVFNIKNNTERYCTLVSVEEIVKTRQLMKEQDFRVQETLNLRKSFLEYIDNVSLTKLQNSAMNQFLKHKISSRKCEEYANRKFREI